MKRHSTLIPLSREHFRMLILAQGLRDGGPPTLKALLSEDRAERARQVKSVFEETIEPHFLVEENQLFPLVRGQDPELERLATELCRQHANLRELACSEDLIHHLDDFGDLLVTHVRTEERRFFQRMQQVFGEQGMRSIKLCHP
ncbi:MAG: hemerythrin domain-containing protein [Polyangiales bacterium]